MTDIQNRLKEFSLRFNDYIEQFFLCPTAPKNALWKR